MPRIPGKPLKPAVRCKSSAKHKKAALVRKAIEDLGVIVPNGTDGYAALCRVAVEHGLDPANLTSDKALVQCNKNAIRGGDVCVSHGGHLPSVIKAARQRLGELVDPSINRIGKIIRKSRHDPTAYKASRDILNSVGLDKLIDQDIPTYEYDESRLELLSTEELQAFMKLLRKLTGPKQEAASTPGPVIEIEATVED